MAAARIAETPPFTQNSRMTRRERSWSGCLSVSVFLLVVAVAPLSGQAVAADPAEPTTLPAVEPSAEASTRGPATEPADPEPSTAPATTTAPSPASPTPPAADQPYSLAELADRAESTAVVVRRVGADA